MREIKYTNRFKRDYKREKFGQHGKKLDVVLMEAVNMLAADTLLPRRYFDYPLSGAHRLVIPLLLLSTENCRTSSSEESDHAIRA
jgi:mRNA-degrading endonuclease YafQ of YafQ-DinJ toxin-antitoxin module